MIVWCLNSGSLFVLALHTLVVLVCSLNSIIAWPHRFFSKPASILRPYRFIYHRCINERDRTALLPSHTLSLSLTLCLSLCVSNGCMNECTNRRWNTTTEFKRQQIRCVHVSVSSCFVGTVVI